MARNSILFLILFLTAELVSAQFYPTQYRVPSQNWREINTEQFRLIYPERYTEEAYRSLAILEREHNDIQALVGGSIRNFPFIINPENDRSNGFVSPLNFRSEIELSPIIGKTMNPRSGDWLETVLPHELVHVMHFSVNPPSFTRFLGLFSPDIRRSVHSAAPLGVFEGIAVQHESHNEIPGSGRGNHPYFRNQFNSMLNTNQEWSMGQLLQVTDFTPPFDRHYIGGYEFTSWLLNRYGHETVKEAIDFHYKYPFLGYGTALKRATGYWPGRLYDQFDEVKKRNEELRLSQIINTTEKSKQLQFDAECRRMSSPKWIDDQTVLFFGRFCNRTTGFYAYNTETETARLIHEVSITPDHIFSYIREKNQIIYSRYYTDSKYDNLAKGDLSLFDLTSKQTQQVTQNKRLFSPEFHSNDLFALQTDAHQTRLVTVQSGDGSIQKVFNRPENSSVIQISLQPGGTGLAAVIGQMQSVQAVWFEHIFKQSEIMKNPPVIVFENGSVYDISWHPGGEKLLFVSDFSGTMDLYEFDIKRKEVRQVTESLYNAMEPSYSPDGNRLAYVTQIENERLVQIIEVENTLNRIIPNKMWSFSELIADQFQRPLMNRADDGTVQSYESKPFKKGTGWLKPRFWLPGYERDSGSDKFSLNFESVDVMSEQAYSAEISHFSDRIWYEAEYINKSFFPGFQAELFNRPGITTFRTEDENGEENTIDLLQQSRGASLKIPLRYRLKSNVRFSSVLFEPQYFLSQIRFFNADNSSEQASAFGTRHTIGLRHVLSLNLRQFTRDLQPNSGWVFFVEGRYGLNSDEITIDAGSQDVTGNLTQRKGIRVGAIRYLSPFSERNQSLRIFGEIYSQTDVPVFNITSRFSDLFSEFPIRGANSVALINNRYTIPLTYPDNGGLLVPAYLSNIYLVLFSQTALNLDNPGVIEQSRSVFGAGVRSRFRLSNLAFDIGISVGWEPTRNEVTYFIGNF